MSESWGSHTAVRSGLVKAGPVSAACFMGWGPRELSPSFPEPPAAQFYLLLAQCAASLVTKSDICCQGGQKD